MPTFTNQWRNLNHPVLVKIDGYPYRPIPLMAGFLEYDEDTIYDLLESAESYGWGDGLSNAFAWSQSAYKVIYIIPDFGRYGLLPPWFPKVDIQRRKLTPQGQVDRFLYLVNCVYGGLPDDPKDISMPNLAGAIIELHDNWGEYVDVEEGDGMEWEIEVNPDSNSDG